MGEPERSHSSTAYEKGNGSATVTRIPGGAEAWDSGILNEQGATYEHTFETNGIYDYFCTPHKSLGMVARIVVGEPGGGPPRRACLPMGMYLRVRLLSNRVQSRTASSLDKPFGLFMTVTQLNNISN